MGSVCRKYCNRKVVYGREVSHNAYCNSSPNTEHEMTFWMSEIVIPPDTGAMTLSNRFVEKRDGRNNLVKIVESD